MNTLTSEQLARQDFVDNQIFTLLQMLNPSNHVLNWNIEMIAEVRDEIESWFIDKMKLTTPEEFYP
ncbi:MAG: hypothetical protein HYZ34_02825 [Ignavibacteriae bacterium]|nr:hypothetical protein [Ignavibacteriota bacterium]